MFVVLNIINEIIRYLRFDAMRSSHYVQAIDKGASAHVNRFLGVLLQNGHLPRILSELAVPIDVGRSLDSAINSLGMSDTTLALVSSLRAQGAATADLAPSTLLMLGRTAEVALTLENVIKERLASVFTHTH